MEPQHLLSALVGLPELQVTPGTTPAEASAALRVLGTFNRCMVGTIRFSGQTPWERHPEDELLYVLEGEVDVTVLLDEGPCDTRVTEGSVFIVPKNRWHRQTPRPVVSLMFVTHAEGSEASWSEDPRLDRPRLQPQEAKTS